MDACVFHQILTDKKATDLKYYGKLDRNLLNKATSNNTYKSLWLNFLSKIKAYLLNLLFNGIIHNEIIAKNIGNNYRLKIFNKRPLF